MKPRRPSAVAIDPDGGIPLDLSPPRPPDPDRRVAYAEATQRRNERWWALREWWAASGFEQDDWDAYSHAVDITWSRVGPPLPPESVLVHNGLSLREVDRRDGLAEVWMAEAGIPEYQWSAVRQRARQKRDLHQVDARRYLIAWPMTDEQLDAPGPCGAG